jgi:hypothetical protein
MLVCVAALSGCSVVAAPCRITGAVLKTVPALGDVAAVPFDACAAVID